MYILKNGKPFTFGTAEDPERFSLPSLTKLSFRQAKQIREIDLEPDTEERGKLIKDFVLSFNPDLEKLGIGDFEYFNIYSAWGKHEGAERLGE